MNKITLSILFFILMTTTSISTVNAAQENKNSHVVISGIKLGDTSIRATKTLQKQCSNLVVKNLEQVKFPLAISSELHLICKKLDNGGQIAVTLADDEVVHVYSKSIPDSEIDDQYAELGGQHSLGFNVYGSDNQLWKKENEKLAILVRPDGIHPNLFVWKSEYLAQTENEIQSQSITQRYPSILKFGSTFSELKHDFEENCSPLQIQDSEPWLLNSPEKQFQVNCFNYYYLGFPRKIEAVFGDDILQLAWVLTAKPEESRIRKMLVSAFGSHFEKNEEWESFDNGRVFLRKDKPEVLLISDILVPFKDKNF
jgi:hypothetical protein